MQVDLVDFRALVTPTFGATGRPVNHDAGDTRRSHRPRNDEDERTHGTPAPNAISWSGELLALAQRYGDATAVSDGGAAISYTGLARRAHAIAGRLLSGGLAPGTPVGMLLPNSISAVCASYGLMLSGACETALGWNITDAELRWAVSLSGVRLVVSTRRREDGLRAMGCDVLPVEDLDGAGAAEPRPPAPADAWGRILFTSGTTGRPKGIVHSHGRRWLANRLLKSALPWAPRPGARILLMTPFTHGASLLTFAWLDHGGEVVLLDGVDIQQVESILGGGDIEAIFAPPTVIAKLAGAFGTRRFAGVRCVFTGTQTLTPALYRKAESMFGACVRITYGKTECTNPITVLDAQDTHILFGEHSAEPGACVGWPAAGVELEVRADDGTSLQAGGAGEIWLRATHMYIGQIDPDGFHRLAEDAWHRTGDFGHLDQRGRLWLEGRLADVIKSGGYKISPDEIEAVLSGLPGCGDICIAALPSEYWGEVIVAVAEKASEHWQVEAEGRVAALSRHLRPRLWVAIETLPRNTQGKVSRREVRARVEAVYTLVDGPHPRLTPLVR